jgi:hypothetical protein
MDWLALRLLPAPTPIGLRISNYEVTRLDLAVVTGMIVIATAAMFWYGNWGWFVITFLLFALMWLWMA